MPSFRLLDGIAALEACRPGEITALTEAATASTFDHDGLTDVQRAANRAIVLRAEQTCRDAAAAEHQHFAVTLDDQGAVGFVIATLHGPDDRELDWMMVHPRAQGSAVSASLMDIGLDWLGRDRAIWLNVLRHNARAIRFYQRYGFAIDPDARTQHAIPHWIMRRSPD